MPQERLYQDIQKYLDQNSISFSTMMINDLPKKWRILGDLALLPATCFTLSEWNNIGIFLFRLLSYSLVKFEIFLKTARFYSTRQE